MHIYFSGIGGVGLGPLAEIALDAGYSISGSDTNSSLMTNELERRGIHVHLNQDFRNIAKTHQETPIDWLVYTSALPEDHPELQFAREHNIKATKRDELLAFIIKEKELKLIAVAGTHGKTTTTAMLVWLFKRLNIPISYSIGSQISFGPSGLYDPASKYFVYECDEFDRNFLHFHPFLSLLVSYDYDHPDTYPTRTDYSKAFSQFLQQSDHVLSWLNEDTTSLKANMNHVTLFDEHATKEEQITLIGSHNRRNGYLAMAAVNKITKIDFQKIVNELNDFPGTARRFEKLGNNLYSDYAHHPAEIAATIQLAKELSDDVVVVYQPHQNSRQHEVKEQYAHCFNGTKKIYWLPTYLSRENKELPLLSPEQLASSIKSISAITADLDEKLWENIERERQNGVLVVLMGAGTIDDWARKKLLPRT